MPRTIKCSICDARSPSYGFKERMGWLRRHRKKKHPTAHKRSVRKAVRTRKKKR